MPRVCPQCQHAIADSETTATESISCPQCGTGLLPNIAWPETVPPAGSDASPTATFPEKQANQAGSSRTLPEIPGYVMECILGQGGMGIVYQARHLQLKRQVALKMIRGGAHADDRELARFRTEAETIARLQHPHIVQIFEIGAHDNLPFVALEFVEGGSLTQHLAGRPQSPAEAARLVEKLARAMHAAHLRGVIHRDLKPANVLLTTDGEPKITDFGLAKQLDSASGHTLPGQVMGTPSYMAPEQAAGRASEIGPRADVYALAAILYEMLTGRPPCRADSVATTLELVREGKISPPRQLERRIPRDLETICLKGLMREPAHRYASAAELADDLWRFLRGEPIMARRVSVLGRGWRWCKRNRLVAALLALCSVGLISLGTVFLLLHLSEQRNVEIEQRNQDVELRNFEAFDLARRTLDEAMAKFPRSTEIKPGDAASLREQLRGALPLYLEHARLHPEDHAIQEELGRLYLRLAVVEIGLTSPTGALEATQQAKRVLGTLVERAPTRKSARDYLATCLSNEALLLTALNRAMEADAAALKGLAIRKALLAEDPASTLVREDLAVEHDLHGVLFEHQGRFAEAEAAYRTSFELYQPSLDARPNDVGGVASQLRHRFNRAGALAELGRAAEADAEFSAGLELAERLWELSLAEFTRVLGKPVAPAPPTPTPGGFHLRLGNLVHRDYGVSVVRRPLTFYTARVRANPDSVHDRYALARSQLHVAAMMLNADDTHPEVEKLARAGMAGLDKLAMEEANESLYTVQAARYGLFLGTLFAARKALETGNTWLREATARLDTAAARTPKAPIVPQLRMTLQVSLATVEFQRGRPLEALAAIDAAQALNPSELPGIVGLAQQIVYEAQKNMLFRDQEGRTDESLKAARQIAGSPSATGISLYDAACILGRSAARKKTGEEREELATLAVAALRTAFQRGFNEGPAAAVAFRGAEPVDYMQKDLDLAILRERADYRQLVAEVQAKKLPAPKEGPTREK